jgi:hypothetical protein
VRAALLLALTLLGGCAATLARPAPTPAGFDRAHAQAAVYGLFDRVVSRRLGGPWDGATWGSCIAIGPRLVITCGHVCHRHERGDVYWIANATGAHEARMLLWRDDDFGGCLLKTADDLPAWIPLGTPQGASPFGTGGWAMIVTLAGQHGVRLHGWPSRQFDGWRPYKGASGSAVIQDGRLVGLAAKQACCPIHPPSLCGFCDATCDPPQWGEYSPVGPVPP